MANKIAGVVRTRANSRQTRHRCNSYVRNTKTMQNTQTNVEEALRPLWRNRDYMLLWSGQVVSAVGSGLTQIAFPLLILALTGSPADAGLAAALGALPYVLFSLPAGALVDRWNRKRVMVLCDTGRALNMGSIAVAFALNHLLIPHLYISMFVEGTLFLFFNVAEAACLPRVVPQAQLPAAFGQNEVALGAAYLIAPPFGGALFQGISAVAPFAVDALSYGVSVVSLLFIRTPFQGERPTVSRKLRAEITEGVVWLWGQPVIRVMASVSGLLNLFNSGITLIVIVRAREQGLSPAVTGLILALGGAGGIVGAVLGGRIQRRFRFGHIIGATCWLSALLWFALALNLPPVLLALVYATVISTIPVYNIVYVSYRAALTPDALQGRVISVARLFVFAGETLGLAMAGLLIEAAGVTNAVLITGAGLVAIALLVTLNRAIQRAPRLGVES